MNLTGKCAHGTPMYMLCSECVVSTHKTTPDPINPAHYKAGRVEVIDFIREQLGDADFAAYCRGNAIKYLSRAGRKDARAQDYGKAAWYCQMAAHVEDATHHADPRGRA